MISIESVIFIIGISFVFGLLVAFLAIKQSKVADSMEIGDTVYLNGIPGIIKDMDENYATIEIKVSKMILSKDYNVSKHEGYQPTTPLDTSNPPN